MKSYILKTNGQKIPKEPQDHKVFQLDEVQKIVGGYVEQLHISGRDIMLVNEDGKLKELPVNMPATRLINRPGDFVVGDVLVCKEYQFK
jgi:hypothetical protein